VDSSHHSGHHHGHAHHHAHDLSNARLGGILKISTIVTLLYVALALAAGYYGRSLALVSEGWHNFSDALSLLLSWLAVYLQSRPPDAVKTFGYHRSAVLAAFVNAVTLLGLSLYIFHEAYLRLLQPATVNAPVMFGVAFVGLAMNGGISAALYRASRDDINIRSSFIHMAGDALGSVGILLGAVAIHFTNIPAIDPVLSILIGGLIIWTAWDIVRESLNILLEGLPRDLTLEQVIGEVRGVAGVLDVHDLHIWTLGPRMLACSCHIRIADIPPSESGEILRRVNHVLGEHFEIRHTTIQFEHEVCIEPCGMTEKTKATAAPTRSRGSPRR
jgi:cobalt-zinc-cadmium efflux system protein